MNRLKALYQKQENRFLTGLFLAVLCGLVAFRYDFYYDLNDDVLMKDILAGVYTGVPESRNIQMLYLISAFIRFFYRLFPAAPWYGLFLCVCQFGSIGLVVNRSLGFCRTWPAKAVLLLLEGSVVTGALLEHLVFVQYTVTCTMLAAAAAFLFLTADTRPEIEKSQKTFFVQSIPSVLLVFVAFLIRSEMLLLVLPMICVAGVCKWGYEVPVFTLPHVIRYVTVFGAILVSLAIGLLTHGMAYGSAEWQSFTRFFDDRTVLYDYQEIPEYHRYEDFYKSIGMTESEQILLHNYNFGLDEEIEEKRMGEIADFAAANRKEEKPFRELLVKKVREYYYRMTHEGSQGDFPWNALILAGYTGLFGYGLCRRKLAGVSWKLCLLLAVRTVLWMYILMGERNPPRIAHSLYYMEFCILSALLLVEGEGLIRGKKTMGQGFPAVMGILILLIAGGNLPAMVRSVDLVSSSRERGNRPWQAMQEYTGERKENFYFIDVYSSVSYSEKMFEKVENGLANYDIMGGWACKSPLYRKKLAAFGLPTMEAALLCRDQVFMIAEDSYDLKWLEEYYLGHGEEITITRRDSIGGIMGVYQILPVKPSMEE